MTILTGKAYYEMPNYNDIPDLFQQTLNRIPNKYAITYREKPNQDPISLTYQELADNILAIQLFWSERLLTNQRIAVVGANSYPWIASYLAATGSQDMVIPLDNLLRPEELAQLLIRSEANMFCLDWKTLLAFKEDLSVFDDLKFIQILNIHQMTSKEKADFDYIKDELSNIDIFSFEEVIKKGKELIVSGSKLNYEKVDPDDSSILIFTSGTTAMAKGVLLSQKAIATDVAALHGMIDFPKDLRSLNLLPLNHTFENTCGLLGVLSVGGHIHICDGLRYVQKNLQEYQIQMFIGVPAIFDSFYSRIFTQIKKQKKDKKLKFALKVSKFLRKIGIDKRRHLFSDILDVLGNLEIAIIGAAPMKVNQIEFFDAIGIRVYEGYGLTETAPVAIANNDFVFYPGSVGQPVPGVQVKIDSNEHNEPAEILIRGPILMNGYYNNPQANQEAFTDDGWFKTGDLGIINPKTSCVEITGREKSMIVLDSGKKVFPEEIEHMIKEQQLAIIKDSMVFNQLADNNQTILSVKFVLDSSLVKEDDPESENMIRKNLDQLLADINKKIPSFKRIKSYIYSHKDMISTSTLKVKRNDEISRLEALKQKLGLQWKEIHKKNIDSFNDDNDDNEEE